MKKKTGAILNLNFQTFKLFAKTLGHHLEICWPLRDKSNLQDLAGNGTFQLMLLEKVNRADPCYFEDLKTLSESLLRKDFFFFFARGAMHILRILNLSYRKNIFISDRSFRSELFVYYLSRSMNKRAKKQFNEEAYVTPENGWKIKVEREISLMENTNYPQVRPTFRSSQEYVKYYTLIDQLKLEDFTFVYLFYIVWSLFLLIFILRLLLHAYRWPLRQSCNVRLVLSSYFKPKKPKKRLTQSY